MAITQDDFKKVWASTSSVPQYTFSDTDYKNGWEFVGNLPPTRAMWDELQRKNDEKMQFLQENGSMCFDSVADMKSSNLDAGQTAFTKGYYSINDGGAGAYSIRGKVAGETEDGGSIIFLDNGNVAELITDGTVSVKQFGAKGDGITDDREAFQKCMTFSPNIYIPKGTYRIVNAIGSGADIYEQRANAVANGTIYPLVFGHDNGSIVIDGAIYGTSALGDVLQITGENVQISGNGTIKGSGVINDTNSSDATQQWKASLIKLEGMNDSATGITCDTPHTISIHACNANQRIHNCTFVGGVATHGSGTIYHHIALGAGNNVNGIIIYGNSFMPDDASKSVYSHVYSWGGGGGKSIVTGNVFGYALEHAIYNYGSQAIIQNNRFVRTDQGVIQSFNENCIIANNEFYGSCTIQLQKANGTTVKGNIFKHEDNGETFSGDMPKVLVRDYQSLNYAVKNIKILENVFELPVVGETVSIQTNYAISDIEVSGNIIEASRNTTTLTSGSNSGAICIRALDLTLPSKNIKIKDNTIRYSSFYGIYLYNVNGCEIAGNYIADCCVNDTMTPRAILLGKTNKNVVVHHNFFEDTKNTHTLTSPIYVLTADDTSFCDNIANGIVPVGSRYYLFTNTKNYQNFRNKINGADYCGEYTSTTRATDTLANAIAQSYNDIKVKLTPIDAKAYLQQASEYALRGTASYGNINFSTSNGNAPTAEIAGGKFMWEIYK